MILTEEEKQYLSLAIVYYHKEKIDYFVKLPDYKSPYVEHLFVCFKNSKKRINIPIVSTEKPIDLNTKRSFKGMEINRKYTLKELGFR